MLKKSRGVIRGAFWKRNERDDTKQTLWGRSQSTLMKMFEYGRDGSTGRITVRERKR